MLGDQACLHPACYQLLCIDDIVLACSHGTHYEIFVRDPRTLGKDRCMGLRSFGLSTTTWGCLKAATCRSTQKYALLLSILWVSINECPGEQYKDM